MWVDAKSALIVGQRLVDDMDCFKVTVRDDEYEEAFKCVGRYLRLLSNTVIVKEEAPVYYVKMPYGNVDLVKKHGDVSEVTGTL